MKNSKSFLDGLFRKNTVFISGLVIAPVVVAANTVARAWSLILSFSIITLVTLLIASFIPRRMVYALRTILYSLIGSVVYIPVAYFMLNNMSQDIYGIGIFLPLMITNSLIISQSELRFLKKGKGIMILDVISYILGFDIAVLITAFVRELLSSGQIGDRVMGIPITFPALSYTFGGFIVLGFLSALVRKIVGSVYGNKEDDA